MRLLIGLGIIILLRVACITALVYIFGRDPNDDANIFELLANKNWVEHILGQGFYSQFPALSPVMMTAFRGVFEPLFGSYWFRASVIVGELIAYVILYKFVDGFRSSWLEYFYIAGLLTVPLTSVWAQDEMIAVLPVLILIVTSSTVLTVAVVSALAFLCLKNFYLFVPFARLLSSKSPYFAIFPVCSIVFMVLIDGTGDFLPRNHFGTTLWTLTSFDFTFQKYASLALFGFFLALVLIVGFYKNLPWRVIYLLIFSAFFNSFYHVNFEYFVFIVLPVIVVYLRKEVSLVSAWLTIVWFWNSVTINALYVLGFSMGSIELARSLHPYSIVFGAILGLSAFLSYIFTCPTNSFGLRSTKATQLT